MEVKNLSDAKLQEQIRWSPYSPKDHKKQAEILDAFDKYRDLRIVGSVRSGKTALCSYIALRELLKDNRNIWIIAPSYDLTERVFDYLIRFIGTGFPALMKGVSRRTPARITTPWNSFIKCKSGENRASLVGEELDLAIHDETALDSEETWQLTFDRLVSRKGKSVHITNPWGHNWWYKEYLRVQGEKDGYATALQFLDNPYNAKSEEDRARKMLDEETFKQKYRALFTASVSSLFRNVDKCIGAKPEEPKDDEEYIIGVDWAKIRDFTVFVVMSRHGHNVVHFDRFQGINYDLQMKRLTELAKKYNNAEIWMDTTGLGEVISDMLHSSGQGLFVEDFRFSGKTKEALLHKLSIYIEKGKILIPDNKVLVNELEVFGKELTVAGNVRYGAPAGFHDDAVDALALANWSLEDYTPRTYTKNLMKDLLAEGSNQPNTSRFW